MRNKIVLAGCDPGHEPARPHGGKAQRRRNRSCAGVEPTGARLAEGRKGAHRRIAPSGSRTAPSSICRSSAGSSRIGIWRSSPSHAGRKDSSCAPGNPKNIRGIEDLQTEECHVDESRTRIGQPRAAGYPDSQRGPATKIVRGYDRVAFGHLSAAHAVLAGEADCCIATRSAAQTFGLDFVPLRSEQYDFVLHRETLRLAAVEALFDALQRATLRRKLETLAGYDTSQTGSRSCLGDEAGCVLCSVVRSVSAGSCRITAGPDGQRRRRGELYRTGKGDRAAFPEGDRLHSGFELRLNRAALHADNAGRSFRGIPGGRPGNSQEGCGRGLGIGGQRLHVCGRQNRSLQLEPRSDERRSGLAQGKFEKIAIANPVTAPYGAAAVEAMKSLGLYERLVGKIVQGNNIAQTFQFVETGKCRTGLRRAVSGCRQGRQVELDRSRHPVLPNTPGRGAAEQRRR